MLQRGVGGLQVQQRQGGGGVGTGGRAAAAPHSAAVPQDGPIGPVAGSGVPTSHAQGARQPQGLTCCRRCCRCERGRRQGRCARSSGHDGPDGSIACACSGREPPRAGPATACWDESMKPGRPPAPASSGAWLDRVWGAQDGGECRQPPAMLDAARRRPGAAGRARPPGGPAARRQSMAGGQQASGARAWPPARRLGSGQPLEAAGTAQGAANCRQQRSGGPARPAAPWRPGAGGRRAGRHPHAAASSRQGLCSRGNSGMQRSQPPRPSATQPLLPRGTRPPLAWPSHRPLMRPCRTLRPPACPAEPPHRSLPVPCLGYLLRRRTRRPATPCGRSACPSWC